MLTGTAAGLARAVAAGEASARDAVDAHLARIDALNPRLNALTRVLREEPLGDGPLAGVPFTVKENIDVRGTPTTFGLAGEFPDKPLDAPHVAHLRAAGAVPVGRGNLPDLALRWDTESARYGRTLNPWDAALSPGGSSGGDAVAVATGMVPFAVGSDYGGSLRVPGALAGVYALRPTPGRVAQSHSVPPSMSRQLFATDGLLARSVEDLRLLLPIMAQPSARDPRWTPAPAASAPGPVGIVLEDAAVRIAAGALADADYAVTPSKRRGWRRWRSSGSTFSPSTPAPVRSHAFARPAARARGASSRACSRWPRRSTARGTRGCSRSATRRRPTGRRCSIAIR